jgi:hypothetical protein
VATPVALLRRQAALLSEKTAGVLEARVVSETFGVGLRHRFVIVVPTLDRYSYELFKVEHNALLYPVHAFFEGLSADLYTEEEFAGWVKTALASPKTRSIVSALFAQAQD